MDSISGANPFTLLLRQRLAERARLAEQGKTSRAGSVRQATPEAAVAPLSALGAYKGPDDHDAHRALVEHLLSTGFGDHMLNQAKFQQLVTQVTQAMESDPELLQQIGQILRSMG